MEFQWKLGILLLLPIATLQISSRESLNYIGAVAEYKPITRTINNESPADINAKNYIKFIKKAVEYSADILVFPESIFSISAFNNSEISLSETASYIPDPIDNIVPCGNTTYANSLRLISCAARDNHIYVVINHREKVDCLAGSTGCPQDNLLIYNTNVAFDHQGKVIARYRKYNLFGERGINTTEDGIISTFETDFGVTFGQFICFDILFPSPALNLTRQKGISDIIFSSHWFSELPFLFSVEAQAGWSYANDVNLLSSGHNNPSTISGGSGIFIGRKGYSHVVMENKPSNILIVSEIPKVIEGRRTLNINKEKVHIYEFNKSEIETSETVASGPYVPSVTDLSPYTIKEIDVKKSSHMETVCNRGLCCDFKLKINFDQNAVKDNTHYYKYKIAVFNGTRSFTGVATGGIKTCGVISCVNDTLSGCGRLIDPSLAIVTPTTFESIEITIRNISNKNVFFMPAGISSDMQPLNVTDYTFETVDIGETSMHSMSLTKAKNNLLTFAIFGRNFAADASEVTTNSSFVCFLSFSLLISLMLFLHVV